MMPDRTYLAVRRQLEAMGGGVFEIGIRDGDGRMMLRSWTKTEVLKAMSWLKRQNARGADIYVRPANRDGQNAGLVLLDDVLQGAIERMKADGFSPAAIIETSPRNFQAWVRLSDKPLTPEIATLAAKMLAEKYGGDPNSADWRHFGRLAGFTNRKPVHVDKRERHPWVLAHECPGKAAEMACKLLSHVKAGGSKEEAGKERQRRLGALEVAKPDGCDFGNNPIHEYRRQAKRLIEEYGKNADFSRLDWMIALDMAKSGRFTVVGIERGISECSPRIEERKAGHVEDYARRTAVKAWQVFHRWDAD